MGPYLVPHNESKTSGYSSSALESGSEGHISRRFRLPSREASEHYDGKSQLENENDDLSKPPKALGNHGESSVVNVRDLGFGIFSSPTKAIDEDRTQDVMSAEQLRMNFGLVPRNGASVKESIRDKIKLCLVQSKTYNDMKGGRFLPIDELDRILSIGPIKALLSEENPKMTRDEFDQQTKSYAPRRRILGILLYMYPEHLQLFEYFINEDVTDDDLPLTPMGDTDECGFRTKDGRENITMLKEWKENDITLFYNYQPIFFVPFFDIKGEKLFNYSFDKAIILPWLECELKTRGGNGTVHKVEIHQSHHNFQGDQPPNEPLYFALKEIPTSDVETYEQELVALEKSCAQMQKETHLIKLLLTFRHGHKYYFLFEWADGTLWDYWNMYPKGRDDAMVDSVWLAEQCLGLATAVKRIHGLATWQKERRKNSSSLGVTTEDEREWGRHGDIKPHNILWFSSYRKEGCLLVLSDLGLTRYHSSVTRSRVSPTSLDGCTELYRPPEMDMPGDHVCPKYDVWSLGCVFLELCTWWLRGLKSVKDFESQRATPDSPDEIFEEPKYFSITTTNGYVKPPQVKGAVLKWIKELRSCAKDDLFAEEMLDLIENEMLIVDKRSRSPVDRVCTDISNIVRRLRNTNTTNALFPAPAVSPRYLAGEIYSEQSGSSRPSHQQKKDEMKTSGLSVDRSVSHAEGIWDSQSSNRRLESTIGYSDTGDEGSGMTAPVENMTVQKSDQNNIPHSTEKEARHRRRATIRWLRSTWARIRRRVK
ncbi:kinase-like domain-containing protein [Nemania abortiva]|nr:kinase-like domain-containing protein [Nemania abortiva]